MPRRDEVEDCPQDNPEKASITTAQATVSRFIPKPPLVEAALKLPLIAFSGIICECVGQKIVPSLNVCQGLFFPIL
jgi:hypothetical protein